jgi:hypothetical protein
MKLPLCSPGVFLDGEDRKLLYNGGNVPRELENPPIYIFAKIGVTSD